MSVHVLSLGAGVQSSAMALMAAAGEITPMPVAAIFADTHWEPKAVYDWLAILEKLLPFPVLRVSHGDLGADFMAFVHGDRKRAASPPFHVRNANSDDRGGMLWRQCTKDYKLDPIIRQVAKLKKEHGVDKVIQWIGISLDEAQRRKAAMVSYVENRYPLVDMRLSRWDCVRWLKDHGYPEPPKSACVFCPYISDRRWERMKRDMPDEFERACRFDEALRAKHIPRGPDGGKITGELFLHSSFKPLREAVLTDSDRGQGEFALECEGMCGV